MAQDAAGSIASLVTLPDEILLQILWYLDLPELLTMTRTSHHLRSLALDPLLHLRRLRYSSRSLARSLPHRPQLQTLQPPSSAIYLTRTHLAARRLHWSLVCIRLNRSLSRRPNLRTLVNANIVPAECCRRDRASGDIVVATDRRGLVVERKRRVERELVKEGLRVWLERKAGEILKRRKDGVGVGVLVWRFSKRGKSAEVREEKKVGECLEKGRVSGLKRFWEGLSRSAQMT
ncbi:hypothetical protein MBLNU457_4356t2 [Dothideomycetes sp. NU457]